MEKMRGLVNFIAEIRKCPTPEDELARVEKELKNIQSKCTGSKTKDLDPYSRKKYTWKLLLIHMLGYNTGVSQDGLLRETLQMFMQMVASTRYQEKLVGYLACSVFMQSEPDLLRMIIHSARSDLTSGETALASLALNTVANVGGEEFAEVLGRDVLDYLLDSVHEFALRKKAALCLINLHRQAPDDAVQEEDIPRLFDLLRGDHLGFVISVANLIKVLLEYRVDNGMDTKVFDGVIPVAVEVLSKMCGPTSDDRSKYAAWTYFHTVSPWIHVKLLQTLALLPPPTSETVSKPLKTALHHILKHYTPSRNVNKNNNDHSVLYEVWVLVLKYNKYSPEWSSLATVVRHVITKYIRVHGYNMRYLGLRAASDLFRSVVDPVHKDKIRRVVTVQFQTADTSIRNLVGKVLFALCDKENGVGVVGDMLKALEIDRSVEKDEEEYEASRRRAKQQQKGLPVDDDDKEDAFKATGGSARDHHLLQKSLSLQRGLKGGKKSYYDYVQYEQYELCRRASVCAEKVAFELKTEAAETYDPAQWYCDIVLTKLAEITPSAIPQDVSYRALHLVSTKPELQGPAVMAAWNTVQSDDTKDWGLRVAVYILGKYPLAGLDVQEVASKLVERLHPEHATGTTRSVILSTLQSIAAGDASVKEIFNKVKEEKRFDLDPKVAAAMDTAVAEFADAKGSDRFQDLGQHISQHLKDFEAYERVSEASTASAEEPEEGDDWKEVGSGEDGHFDDILHIQEGDEAKKSEQSAEWEEFQKFLTKLQGLNPVTFKPVWRKIQQAMNPAPVKDSSDGAPAAHAHHESDKQHDIYHLETGEAIQVDPTHNQSMIGSDALKHGDQEDVWAAFDQLAAENPGPQANAAAKEDWVAF